VRRFCLEFSRGDSIRGAGLLHLTADQFGGGPFSGEMGAVKAPFRPALRERPVLSGEKQHLRCFLYSKE